jgi:virginiamycin B lyase
MNTPHRRGLVAGLARIDRVAVCTVALALLACTAHAGGSHYGPAPGAPERFEGALKEWAVPEPAFPRDPTPAPDGSLYFVHMLGDRLGRFDPKSERFESWPLPAGTRPHNVVVDSEGIAWITGQSAHAMLRFDPRSGQTQRIATQGDPHTAIIDAQGTLWFTMAAKGWIGRLDRKTLALQEIKVRGIPYGLTVDAKGRVWTALINQHRLAIIDPATAAVRELPLADGSAPMRMAAAPDGRLWATLHGSNRLIAVDPVAEKVVEDIALPAGPQGKAYAVTIDRAGTLWVNEINTDTVLRRAVGEREWRVFELPTARAAIRKMVVDAEGALWYLGTNNNRLGRIR